MFSFVWNSVEPIKLRNDYDPPLLGTHIQPTTCANVNEQVVLWFFFFIKLQINSNFNNNNKPEMVERNFLQSTLVSGSFEMTPFSSFQVQKIEIYANFNWLINLANRKWWTLKLTFQIQTLFVLTSIEVLNSKLVKVN